MMNYMMGSADNEDEAEAHNMDDVHESCKKLMGFD